MAFDHLPCRLRSAWMYSIEADTEELYQPDLLFDVSEVFDLKLAAVTDTRPIFPNANAYVQTLKIINGFWGLRCHVQYAEPLYQAWGSMKLAQLTRDHFRVRDLPLIPR